MTRDEFDRVKAILWHLTVVTNFPVIIHGIDDQVFLRGNKQSLELVRCCDDPEVDEWSLFDDDDLIAAQYSLGDIIAVAYGALFQGLVEEKIGKLINKTTEELVKGI